MTQLTLMTSPDAIVKIDTDCPEQKLLDQAAELLNSDKLVVAPSDTRYALLARTDSKIALDKLFSAKKRSKDHPVSIFVENIDQIVKFANMNKCAGILAEAFLPGPLTLILPARDDNSFDLGSVTQEGRIGVRIPCSSVISGLIRLVDVPLTATSANLSGKGDLKTIEQIFMDFGNQISMYLDGGILSNPASTVVDCAGATFRIIREGEITIKMIDSALHSRGKDIVL